MSDNISFKVFAEPFHKAIQERQVRMRRAAMWAVREGGRTVKRVGRDRAPVLKDDHAMRYGDFRRRSRIGKVSADRPVAGLLKNSIAPSRRLKDEGEVWSLKVGPRGPRVHLYAGKEEDRAHYMETAYAVTESMQAEIARRAFEAVWKDL